MILFLFSIRLLSDSFSPPKTSLFPCTLWILLFALSTLIIALSLMVITYFFVSFQVNSKSFSMMMLISAFVAFGIWRFSCLVLLGIFFNLTIIQNCSEMSLICCLVCYIFWKLFFIFDVLLWVKRFLSKTFIFLLCILIIHVFLYLSTFFTSIIFSSSTIVVLLSFIVLLNLREFLNLDIFRC